MWVEQNFIQTDLEEIYVLILKQIAESILIASAFLYRMQDGAVLKTHYFKN
jgi:hypothetical protein